MYLSKSDFKAARICATKLYYRKLRYPSASHADPYLEFLADGGYMVEAVARVLYPGIEIVGESDGEEFELTQKALVNEDITLFQAALIYGQLLAKVDVLEKQGNRFRLIEVKAKTFEPLEERPNPFRAKRTPYPILAKWKPYLEDVAFQTLILKRLYPDAEVTSHLCLVDKSQISTGHTTFHDFCIQPRDAAQHKPQITFNGDKEAIRQQSFLRLFDVSVEVAELLPEVDAAASEFVESLANDKAVRLEPKLGAGCKDCEYRIDQPGKSGFRECWGELADESPHLLDLYYVGSLGKELIAEMVGKGKARLSDVNPEMCVTAYGKRQKRQLSLSPENCEYTDPMLVEILKQQTYPLHFVDFEASRSWIPYYPRLRPYDQVAFQWSCHTIPAPGAPIVHNEWISLADQYPNFEFARSLKEHLGINGTVFTWSHFERSVLKDILDQMKRMKEEDKSLSEWLEAVISKGGPIVDLYKLATDFYVHRDMGGSVSIKTVLPIIWSIDQAVRDQFPQYLKIDNGKILDPYQALPGLPFGDDTFCADDGEAVREGTAAVRTYQEMMFGARRDDSAFQEGKKQLLLQYCELDTAAMVMIWMHWVGSQHVARQ